MNSAVTNVANFTDNDNGGCAAVLIYVYALDVSSVRVMPVVAGSTWKRASVREGSAVLLFREWPRQRTSHEGVKPRAGKAIVAAGGGGDEDDSKN